MDQRKQMFQKRISSEAQLMNGLILEISIAGDSTGAFSIGKLVHIHILKNNHYKEIVIYLAIILLQK